MGAASPIYAAGVAGSPEASFDPADSGALREAAMSGIAMGPRGLRAAMALP